MPLSSEMHIFNINVRQNAQYQFELRTAVQSYVLADLVVEFARVSTSHFSCQSN